MNFPCADDTIYLLSTKISSQESGSQSHFLNFFGDSVYPFMAVWTHTGKWEFFSKADDLGQFHLLNFCYITYSVINLYKFFTPLHALILLSQKFAVNSLIDPSTDRVFSSRAVHMPQENRQPLCLGRDICNLRNGVIEFTISDIRQTTNCLTSSSFQWKRKPFCLFTRMESPCV